MNVHVRPLVIVEPRAFQLCVVQFKSKRLDQVQASAAVGAQAYDVTGIRGNFRLEEGYVDGHKVETIIGIVTDMLNRNPVHGNASVAARPSPVGAASAAILEIGTVSDRG